MTYFSSQNLGPKKHISQTSATDTILLTVDLLHHLQYMHMRTAWGPDFHISLLPPLASGAHTQPACGHRCV